jgi:hypothetical protein
VPKLNNILLQLFMDMIKKEASIHEAPSEMSTLNDECFTVIKSEGDHGAVAPAGDKVGIFLRSQIYHIMCDTGCCCFILS